MSAPRDTHQTPSSLHGGRQFVARLGVGCLIFLGMATIQERASADDAQLPLELQPYRILVTVAFDSAPALTARYRQQVLEEMAEAAERTVGQMWELHLHENRWLSPSKSTSLERLSIADFEERFETGTYDMIAVLTVENIGPRYLLAGRAWHAGSRQFSSVATTATYQRSTVGIESFRTLHRLFRPVFVLEEGGDQTVVVRARAGELLPPDEDALPIQPGDLLQPYFRYLSREMVVQRIQMLPWTYLRVDEVERARATCSVISGLRSPLAGQRRRVEVQAMRIRPELPHTQLKLVPQTQPAKPLIGYDVDVFPKRPAGTGEAAEEELTPQRFSTDRRGKVTLPVDAGHPLVWLEVRNGQALLARLPFVPGVLPAATLQLPDDSLRLAVEGELALLQGRLTDRVAQRATLMARIRRLARNGEWSSVDEQLARLDELTETTDLQRQLNAIRVPALEKAKAHNNRMAQARIRRLCDETSDLIQYYLDPDRVRQLKEEIAELRSLGE